MTEKHISNPNKGLSLNSKAPLFDCSDIYGNIVKLGNLLSEYDGILLEFFRGAW
jgi:hypothetical protein